MVYKAVATKGKPPFGGPVSILVATSASPLGPFKKQPKPIFGADGVPIALFCAAADAKGRDGSFNIQIPLQPEKSAP